MNAIYRLPSARPHVPLPSSVLLASLLALAVVAPAAGASPSDLLVQAAPPSADSVKKVLVVDDYARWRTLGDEGISGDGQWVTWVYRFTNVAEKDAKPELHVLNLGTDEDVAIPNATGGTFSPDGRWIVYQVDSTPPRSGRGAGEGSESAAAGGREGASGSRTTHRVELRELATGKTRVWHDMQSATFNQASTFVLVRNRPRAGRGGGGFGGARGGGGPAAPSGGSDAILHDLRTGRSQLLGSVGDAAFNRTGVLLAYTVDAEVRDGNGLFVMDLASGSTGALDNAARTYGRLAWNDAGTGVAVLKGQDVPKMRERDNVLLVVPDVPTALADAKRAPATLDTAAAGFPRGWVISERAPLTWSENGARAFPGPHAADARRGHGASGELGHDHRRGRVEHRRPLHPVGADGPRPARP